jgi:hypothetical protein
MSSADLSSPVNLGSGHPSEPVVAHIMAQAGVQRTPSSLCSSGAALLRPICARR